MDDWSEKAAIERAKRIIEILGGVAEVCKITGRSRTRVYSWTYLRSKHGTGGMIPPECQQMMLEHARLAEKPLCPDHFFPPVQADPPVAEDAA